MGTEKMPISLLKNPKTSGYLLALFAILQEAGSKEINTLTPDYNSLKKKITDWCDLKASMRLDLNAPQSELFEKCSHAAHHFATQKKNLSPAEKSFIEQHDFFFKN